MVFAHCFISKRRGPAAAAAAKSLQLCPTLQLQRWQPTRLRRPWDSPGKNIGVSCHFLLQCRKLKSESDVAQSFLTPRDPLDCSPPGSSVHGIFQARVLEWGATVNTTYSLECRPSGTVLRTAKHGFSFGSFFHFLNSLLPPLKFKV